MRNLGLTDNYCNIKKPLSTIDNGFFILLDVLLMRICCVCSFIIDSLFSQYAFNNKSKES